MATTYPEDRTASLASNVVSDEIHTVSTPNGVNYHLLLPRYAPFYSLDFTVHRNISGTWTELTLHSDYYLCFKFESASISTAKEVFGGVVLLGIPSGQYKISYRTVGGNWVLDDSKLLEIAGNEVFNPRGRTWDQIHGKPETFGPTSHIHDPSDFLTEQEVGQKLDDIATAIASLINRPANNITITKAHLGLSNVENWTMSTVQETIDGISTDVIVNPFTLAELIKHLKLDKLADDLQKFRDHLNDKSNPHEVNKIQIGLSQVANLPPAPDSLVIANKDHHGLISLKQLRTYVAMYGCNTCQEFNNQTLGTLLSTKCTEDNKKTGIYADGTGGTYERTIETNSQSCIDLFAIAP